MTPIFSVIMPAYNAAAQLPITLAALVSSDLARDHWELVVVDDASSDGTKGVAEARADRVVVLPGQPHGPGYARNRGVENSHGEWLVFIDADVSVHRDTLRRFAEAIDADAGIDALFGAYDDSPPAPGFLSQYRNLLHRQIHLSSPGLAETFWAGCGAVRRTAFVEAGGFDERRYPRPQIEDIELGYRLRDHGYRIVIRPEIQAAHLKRWRFLGSLRTDLLDRGIPWVTLLLERGTLARPASLNLKSGERVRVGLMGVALLLLLIGMVQGGLLLLGGASLLLLGIVLSNLRQFRWFSRLRGPVFALATVPMNLVYYLVSGVAVIAAIALHFFRSRTPSSNRETALPALDTVIREPPK